MTTIGLYAAIRILGADIEFRRTELLQISLEPSDLASGINGFAGKVYTAICDTLYEIQGQNGRIKNTVLLDVTTCGGDSIGYRKGLSLEPSKELWKKVAETAEEMTNNLKKDLSHAILHHPKFQAQRIHHSPAEQRKSL